MINKIRDIINEKKGLKGKFRFNGARNQIEEFEGFIDGVYNFVFTIKTINNITKSFSYSDILIGNLELIE